MLYDYDHPRQSLLEKVVTCTLDSPCCTGCEVEVYIRTAKWRSLRIIAATDVGAALKPLGLQGQVRVVW